MILLEWFEGDANGIGGELFYGENAYRRLIELRNQYPSFYSSINQKLI